MKLKKLILSTAFIALAIQTSISSELPIGKTTVNIDPFFVSSQLYLDNSQNEITLSGSASSEFVDEDNLVCEDHFSISLENAYHHRESGEIRVKINGGEKTIGVVKGRIFKRIRLSENVKISHEKQVDDLGNSELSFSVIFLDS